MKSIKPTATPWDFSKITSAAFRIYKGQDTLATVVAHLGSPVLMDRDGEGKANVHLIVEACNAWNNPDALKKRIAELESK